jgi:hypothetical protein
MRKPLFVLIILLVSSCSQGKKPFEKRVNKVLGGPVFRNLTIGDSYNKVLKTENKDYMQFPDSNLIKYRYMVSDSEEYHWVYIFQEDKIKEIQFDAYLGEPEDGGRYTKILQKKYDKIWGPSTSSKGIISWAKDGVSADLIDESPVVSMGKVKLFIYATGDSVVHRYIPEI